MTKKILTMVIGVILLGGIAALGYLYFDAKKDVSELQSQVAEKDQKLEDFKSNPERAAEEEVTGYIEEVNKLYALPTNEKPSVATVSDKDKLKDQPFFAKAENGDITLIYAQSKLAILYRPSTKQLVNVSSVTISDDEKTPETRETPETAN